MKFSSSTHIEQIACASMIPNYIPITTNDYNVQREYEWLSTVATFNGTMHDIVKARLVNLERRCQQIIQFMHTYILQSVFFVYLR